MHNPRLQFPVSVTLTSEQWAIVYADLLWLQEKDEDEERALIMDEIWDTQQSAFLARAVREVTGL